MVFGIDAIVSAFIELPPWGKYIIFVAILLADTAIFGALGGLLPNGFFGTILSTAMGVVICWGEAGCSVNIPTSGILLVALLIPFTWKVLLPIFELVLRVRLSRGQ